MSNEITSWLRAFYALQASAMESRGFVEIQTGTDDVVRWPATTGADVVAIAALIDPYVRALPVRFGGHGVGCRWRAVIDELEHALVMPLRPYAENRAFWRTLPSMFVYLHAQEAPVPPPETWEALFALLADTSELRNVGPKGDGPFKHFDNIKTFDELYLAQYKHLRDLRGVDEGSTPAIAQIPRTTNADVVQLADYWSKQFASVKQVSGHAGVAARWKAAMVDVDALARQGDPNATYPKNLGFWPALRATAIHIAVADEAPSKWDLAVDSIKESIKALPDNLTTGAAKAADALVSAAGDVAGGVGKIANQAGKGLFSGFGTPMLVGAGLLGLFLISRTRGEKGAG